MTNTIATQFCNNVPDGQAVLRVEHPMRPGSVATLRFQREVNSPATGNLPRVVVETEGESNQVTIVGEDLWQLRRLLLELPEEAFVEPVPEWTPGDVVVYTGALKIITYVRRDTGRWARTVVMVEAGRVTGSGSSHVTTEDVDDAALVDLVANHPAYRVVRKQSEDIG